MSSKNTEKLNELTSELIKNQPKLIEYDLKRLELAMTRLGSPQSDIKNIIHVAGTNGKGSTIATLKALLKGHGFSVNFRVRVSCAFSKERQSPNVRRILFSS